MNISTLWDFENNQGELIVHKKKERITNFVSPANTIHEFEDWVNKSVRFISVTQTEATDE